MATLQDDTFLSASCVHFSGSSNHVLMILTLSRKARLTIQEYDAGSALSVLVPCAHMATVGSGNHIHPK